MYNLSHFPRACFFICSSERRRYLLTSFGLLLPRNLSSTIQGLRQAFELLFTSSGAMEGTRKDWNKIGRAVYFIGWWYDLKVKDHTIDSTDCSAQPVTCGLAAGMKQTFTVLPALVIFLMSPLALDVFLEVPAWESCTAKQISAFST